MSYEYYLQGKMCDQYVYIKLYKYGDQLYQAFSALKDHNPPHIHFTYGDYECSISVLDRIVDGQAPAKVIAKVNEWVDLHEAEILSLWEKAQKGEKIEKIEPLK